MIAEAAIFLFLMAFICWIIFVLLCIKSGRGGQSWWSTLKEFSKLPTEMVEMFFEEIFGFIFLRQMRFNHKRNQNGEKVALYEVLSFKSLLFDQERDCPICLVQFTDDDTVVPLACNKFHMYH